MTHSPRGCVELPLPPLSVPLCPSLCLSAMKRIPSAKSLCPNQHDLRITMDGSKCHRQDAHRKRKTTESFTAFLHKYQKYLPLAHQSFPASVPLGASSGTEGHRLPNLYQFEGRARGKRERERTRERGSERARERERERVKRGCAGGRGKAMPTRSLPHALLLLSPAFSLSLSLSLLLPSPASRSASFFLPFSLRSGELLFTALLL